AALRASLDPSVIVLWTGTAVIAPTITVDRAAAARAVYGHEILVWDNYPVNDYIPGRLPMAAYTGRQPGLSGKLLGVLSNPANQGALARRAAGDVRAPELGHGAGPAWAARQRTDGAVARAQSVRDSRAPTPASRPGSATAWWTRSSRPWRGSSTTGSRRAAG